MLGLILGGIAGCGIGVVQRWVRREDVRAIAYWVRQSIGVWAMLGAVVETLAWRVFGRGGSVETVLAVGGVQGAIVGMVQAIGLERRRWETQTWVAMGVLLGGFGAHVGNNHIGGVVACMVGLLVGEAAVVVPMAMIWTMLASPDFEGNRNE